MMSGKSSGGRRFDDSHSDYSHSDDEFRRPQYMQPQSQAPVSDPMGFLDALKHEYLDGSGGAVQEYLDSGVPQHEMRVITEIEDRVRDSPNREAAIQRLEVEWGLRR